MSDTGIQKSKYGRYVLLAILILIIAGFFLSTPVFKYMGHFLIADDSPLPCDAIVVLFTGMEYYPRLIEAADLYRKKIAPLIVINGNRKTDELRKLEQKGFAPCCLWYEDYLRILSLFGVPEDSVLCISAEDVYDTVTEAKYVGKYLMEKNVRSITIVTSKSHTRRAKLIWDSMYNNQFAIRFKAAQEDPYDPDSWWKNRRQVRWVMAEYGAYLYLVLKQIKTQG